MNYFNYILTLCVGCYIISCDSGTPNIKPSVKFDKGDKIFHLGEEALFSVNAQNLDSLHYIFQGQKFSTLNGDNLKLSLDKAKLGEHKLEIITFFQEESTTIAEKILILNNVAPKLLGYKIVNEYPHNEKDYTQGLEYHNGKLYESAGKYGESRLLEKELVTGATVKTHRLSDAFFAEGITIVNDKIHQLTWKGDLGFTYNLSDFKQTGTFSYQSSKQGWGLCYDGKNTIYKSDGSTKIWLLDALTLAEKGFIEIGTNKALKSRFNELEWIEGKIYANTWQKDSIAIINPENGAIDALINLNGIREKVGVAPEDNDKVLNGIAYDKDTKKLYITGKYWNKLFQIEVVD